MTGAHGELSPLGAEALDSPTLDPELARATLRDIAIANRLFGGVAAVRFGIRRLVDPVPRDLVIADVGAGAGDVLDLVTRSLRRSGCRVRGIALDFHAEATRMAREGGQLAARADAFRLPLASRSVDIVVASQLLHHYARAAAGPLLAELARIARLGVVIADLRRTTAAAWGIALAARLLRFHPISRADGVLSVQRGFTAAELAVLCHAAGHPAHVHRRPGFRLVAYWRVDHVHH
jgi:2-polyprenyl-3-methyl-5-hydroxy-6-metoxy-1,4-benzoquinol methylase